MDETPVAEQLPEVYRHVLDRVADLEVAGYRHEADLVRRDATAAYSGRWTSDTMRRLGNLAARADRVIGGRERPRTRRPARGTRLAAWLRWSPGAPRWTRVAVVAEVGPTGPMTPERRRA